MSSKKPAQYTGELKEFRHTGFLLGRRYSLRYSGYDSLMVEDLFRLACSDST